MPKRPRPPVPPVEPPPVEPPPVVGELVIPETKPYPNGAAQADESFSFMLQCINDVDRTGKVLFECPVTVTGDNHHCTFDYIGHSMPYLYSEAVPGNHDHGWWVPGDRQGYVCGYAFMYDKHPSPMGHTDTIRLPGEGVFIARATAVRPATVGYGKVNDQYMEEGIRHYDGTLATGEGQELPEDAQAMALDDFDYNAYQSVGPQDIRIGLFRKDGEIADIRDFTNVEVVNGLDNKPVGWFEFVHAKPAPDKGGFRSTMVFVLRKNMKVSHVVYYDALTAGGGRMAVEVNGVKVAEG